MRAVDNEIRQPLAHKPIVRPAAGLRAMLPEIVILAVKSHDGLSGRFVQTIGRDPFLQLGHHATSQNGRLPLFSGLPGRTARRRQVRKSCLQRDVGHWAIQDSKRYTSTPTPSDGRFYWPILQPILQRAKPAWTGPPQTILLAVPSFRFGFPCLPLLITYFTRRFWGGGTGCTACQMILLASRM